MYANLDPRTAVVLAVLHQDDVRRSYPRRPRRERRTWLWRRPAESPVTSPRTLTPRTPAPSEPATHHRHAA